MLPVGAAARWKPRKQVFIYTLELVGLTLLVPLFNLAGSIYLISALVLGLWLIGVAWRVLKQGGNKIAWTMYRTSSMYLAFLFLARAHKGLQFAQVILGLGKVSPQTAGGFGNPAGESFNSASALRAWVDSEPMPCCVLVCVFSTDEIRSDSPRTSLCRALTDGMSVST